MEIYFVDSFTTEPFKGNPAAVCMTSNALSPSTMQDMATEIGFSETAFLCQIDENTFGIRFFSPKTEIPICGHATLAAANVLFEASAMETIVFKTQQQINLMVARCERKIKMKFPLSTLESFSVPMEMLHALGILEFLKSNINAEYRIIVIEIPSVSVLQELSPDYQKLLSSYNDINGVVVTAASTTDEYDFQYRYFWPWSGSNEDPVTGGVQTFLTKYWSNKLNKKTLHCYQPSQRGGSMTTELTDHAVYIYGNAVITLKGNWLI